MSLVLPSRSPRSPIGNRKGSNSPRRDHLNPPISPFNDTTPRDRNDTQRRSNAAGDINYIPTLSKHNTHKTYMEVGLENLGNTCFMNSSLQCLLHIQPLVSYFLATDIEKVLNEKSSMKGLLASSFAHLVREIFNATAGSSIAPLDFQKVVGYHAPHLLDNQQQDCQEFLRFLLDGMSEDLCRRRIISKKTVTRVIPEKSPSGKNRLVISSRTREKIKASKAPPELLTTSNSMEGINPMRNKEKKERLVLNSLVPNTTALSTLLPTSTSTTTTTTTTTNPSSTSSSSPVTSLVKPEQDISQLMNRLTLSAERSDRSENSIVKDRNSKSSSSLDNHDKNDNKHNDKNNRYDNKNPSMSDCKAIVSQQFPECMMHLSPSLPLSPSSPSSPHLSTPVSPSIPIRSFRSSSHSEILQFPIISQSNKVDSSEILEMGNNLHSENNNGNDREYNSKLAELPDTSRSASNDTSRNTSTDNSRVGSARLRFKLPNISILTRSTPRKDKSQKNEKLFSSNEVPESDEFLPKAHKIISITTPRKIIMAISARRSFDNSPHSSSNGSNDSNRDSRDKDSNKDRYHRDSVVSVDQESLLKSQKVALEESQKAWTSYLNLNDSVVTDIFAGQLQSTIECLTCRNRSYCFDTFLDLSVPIPKGQETKSKWRRHSASTEPSKCPLEDCIEKFTGEELLDGDNMVTCSNCKEKRKCTKKLSIFKYPRVLVIHIKRFKYSEISMEKLSTDVIFPIKGLNLTPYLSSDISSLPIFDTSVSTSKRSVLNSRSSCYTNSNIEDNLTPPNLVNSVHGSGNDSCNNNSSGNVNGINNININEIMGNCYTNSNVEDNIMPFVDINDMNTTDNNDNTNNRNIKNDKNNIEVSSPHDRSNNDSSNGIHNNNNNDINNNNYDDNNDNGLDMNINNNNDNFNNESNTANSNDVNNNNSHKNNNNDNNSNNDSNHDEEITPPLNCNSNDSSTSDTSNTNRKYEIRPEIRFEVYNEIPSIKSNNKSDVENNFDNNSNTSSVKTDNHQSKFDANSFLPTYDLLGVSNHCGTLNGGHYVAHVNTNAGAKSYRQHFHQQKRQKQEQQQQFDSDRRNYNSEFEKNHRDQSSSSSSGNNENRNDNDGDRNDDDNHNDDNNNNTYNNNNNNNYNYTNNTNNNSNDNDNDDTTGESDNTGGDDARWMCFNDEHVSTASAANIIGPSAYILFYRLRES